MSKPTKYTKEILDAIFKLREEGFGNARIGTCLPEVCEGVKKEMTESAVEHVIRRFKHEYSSKKGALADTVADLTEKRMFDTFVVWVKNKKYIPTLAAFCRTNGFSAGNVRKIFGSFSELEARVKASIPEIFESIIDETSFTHSNFTELKKEVSSFKRFFVTTAVTGCKPHDKGLLAIKAFCKKMKAKLLIILVSDPSNMKDKKYKFSAHHELPQDSIVFEDLHINSNLFLSTIKLSAKQIQPLTGLRGLGLRGSCILGSPKQFLEAVSTSNEKEIPRHLMTTGAITVPEYETKRYMSERTSYLAKEAHVLGGIIVEIKDTATFFYRHVQINARTGAFSDLNKQYFPDGNVKTITAEVVQQPDWHTGSTCPEFKRVTKEIVKMMKPRVMTLEDFFDGKSINPFDRKAILQRALSFFDKPQTLQDELKLCRDELDDLCDWPVEEIVIKYGNHDDFLKRWLTQAEYATDPVNHHEGLCLAKAMMERTEKDKTLLNVPFEYAMRKMYPIKNQGKVTFLRINDSLKIDGIENAAHGHLGSAGKRNPGLKGLGVYGPCNTGHTHAAGIFGQVFRAGTATHLRLSYNDGASSWSNTLLIQHKDKSRQLITVIEGEFRI